MEFFYRQEINGKQFVVVHAGYIESLAGVDTDDIFDTLEDFIYMPETMPIYTAGWSAVSL